MSREGRWLLQLGCLSLAAVVGAGCGRLRHPITAQRRSASKHIRATQHNHLHTALPLRTLAGRCEGTKIACKNLSCLQQQTFAKTIQNIHEKCTGIKQQKR